MFLATTPGITRFTYHFFDDCGAQVGALRWPDVAVATNARLKSVYPKSWNRRLVMEVGEETYDIVFEYLNRGWDNDVKFRLVQEQNVLASADVIRNKSFFGRHPTLRLDVPFEAQLVNRGGWLSLRFELQQAESMIGSIFEARRFSLKRRITIDLPDTIERPVQFFLFFLVINTAH